MKNSAFLPPEIIIGMWQVAGGHGEIDHKKAIQDMLDYHQAGFRTWDVADHYGPAEEFIKIFRKEVLNKFGAESASEICAYTKWVPTDVEKRWTLEADYSLEFVEKNIDRSLQRMGVESLDLLQIHWWDYDDKRIFDVLNHLSLLKKKGKN